MKMKKNGIMMNKDTRQNLIIVAAYIVILAVFAFQSEYFLRGKNIAAMLVAAVPLGLIAISECLCLLTGNLDMAPGMIASLSGVIWALLITKLGMNVWLAFAAALLFGLIAGFCSGLLVSYLKLPAFIATYGMMLIWQGIIHIVTNGEAISMKKDRAFKLLGQTKLFGTAITLPVLFLVVIYLIMIYVMKKTPFGRSLYVIGGNRDAAVNIGINIRRATCVVFIISALLSALAGLLFASRSAAAQPTIGETYAMQAIAATVVGGTKMGGGKASIGMTFLGVLIVIAIQNGLNMIGVNSFYQFIANGLIVFAAVFIQTDRKAI